MLTGKSSRVRLVQVKKQKNWNLCETAPSSTSTKKKYL